MSRPSSASIPSGRPNTRATSRADSTPAAEPTRIAGTMPAQPISVLECHRDPHRPESPPRPWARCTTHNGTPPAAGSPFLTANITSTAHIVAAAATAAVDATRAAKATTAHDKSASQTGNSTTVATLGEHGQCSNVNSLTPGAELSLPLSMMVSAAASALHAAPAADPMQDFPALPAPGEEAMTTSAAVRCHTPPSAPHHGKPDTPPPMPLTDDSLTVAIGVEAASEARSDADTNDYHLVAETARAVAASLGQDVEASAPSASTSHPPAPPASSRWGPSPPKRPRIDTGSVLFASDTQSQSAISPMTRTAVENAIVAHIAPTPHVPLPHVPLLPFPFPVHEPAPQLPPNPGRHTTNPPLGGWQLRTGTEQPRVLRNLVIRQNDLWRESAAQGPCILLQVHRGITNEVATARAISSFIIECYNVQPNTFRVGIAGAEDPRARVPNAGIIAGLPQFLVNSIVAAETISTTAITFFTLPFDPPFTGYLGIVVGLGHDNTPASATAARVDIQASLTEAQNPHFMRHILENHNALPAHLTADQVIAVFTTSIHVVPIDLATSGGLQTEWRVFSMVTTNDINRYYATWSAFANIVFYTFSYDARVRADMNCEHCFSIDHPMGICPFPSTAGWMGNTHPAPTTAPPAITNIGSNTNANTTTNMWGGSRGQGRARGHGGRGGRGGRGHGF
ncbi:hypothetical protein C8J57DRAFT_1251274 [Mycena rebaudengoi]|nr:hypothetical protein C8J57DRAFT_1251274 [Mycena rebaudengoi]